MPKNFALTFLIRKVSKRISHRNTPIYFGEAFEIPKDFSRKVLCVRVWGDAPTDNAHNKKARRCRVFLYSVFFDLKHHLLIYLVFGGIDDNTVVVFPIYLHIFILAPLAVVYGARFCFDFEGK